MLTINYNFIKPRLLNTEFGHYSNNLIEKLII